MSRENKQKVWEVYVADAVRMITENTAKFASGQYIEKRYLEILESKPQDTRTGEQIVADVVKKAGLKVVSK